jgi:hypothetical protein
MNLNLDDPDSDPWILWGDLREWWWDFKTKKKRPPKKLKTDPIYPGSSPSRRQLLNKKV